MTVKARTLFAIAVLGLVTLPAATASAVTLEYTYAENPPGSSVYHYVLKVSQDEWNSLKVNKTRVTLYGLAGVSGATDPVNFSPIELDSTHVTWLYDYAAETPPSDFQWPYVFVCFAIYVKPPVCEGAVDWEVIWQPGGGNVVGTTFGPRPCAQLASLGDRVWGDLDADRVQDDGEAGLEGVTRVLKDPNGSVIATTSTGSNGIYVFSGHTPGQHTVCLDQSTLLVGYVQTYDLVPPLDHRASVTLASGENRMDVDFDCYRPHPGISLTKCAHKTTICCGETVTYTYEVQHTGGIALLDVTVIDDPGTATDTSDDFVVSTLNYLAPAQEASFWKRVALECEREPKASGEKDHSRCYPPRYAYRKVTNTATATAAADITGQSVSAMAQATVQVKCRYGELPDP